MAEQGWRKAVDSPGVTSGPTKQLLSGLFVLAVLAVAFVAYVA